MRARMSSFTDSRVFRNTAVRYRAINIVPQMMRGGIRL